MKFKYLLPLLLMAHLSFSQTIEEEYAEALYFSAYNDTLQEFFNKVVEIKPIQATGEQDRIVDYLIQPNSDLVVTQITFRIIGTLPDDNLEKDGSLKRVGIVDLIGTHQFKPLKYSIYLDYYDQKLDERKVPDYPTSWEEMDMTLDIISLSFKKEPNEEAIKYIKKKRSLASQRVNYLSSKYPNLAKMRLTDSQKKALSDIHHIEVTKNSKWSYQNFECEATDTKVLAFPRIWGTNFLEGTMYSLPTCLKAFNNLKEIKLPKHEVEAIPAFLSTIETLEVIDLSKNKLRYLPKNLEDFTSLKKLLIADNFVLDIPDDISFPATLEAIDLSNNYLREVPKQLLKLNALKSLNLKGNRIPEKEIEKLKKKMKSCEIYY
ncbi:MAG: leucine-rich repeat domain-containing protein [Thermonemataceae bacterium]